MKVKKTIGVLAFHGDVTEHIETTKNASKKLKLNVIIVPVRTKEALSIIDALIIPGGESTTLYKLCAREGMWSDMKQIKYIFGTCAGAIMLAKSVSHRTFDQKTLSLMDIEIDRNSYGRQTESFDKDIKTSLGDIHAIFIRAPKIINTGKNIKTLARDGRNIIACEQRVGNNYYLATCFHPELSSTLFHEYFIKKVFRVSIFL